MGKLMHVSMHADTFFYPISERFSDEVCVIDLFSSHVFNFLFFGSATMRIGCITRFLISMQAGVYILLVLESSKSSNKRHFVQNNILMYLKIHIYRLEDSLTALLQMAAPGKRSMP